MKFQRVVSFFPASFAALACLGGGAHADTPKFDWSSIQPGMTLQTWLVEDTTGPSNKLDFRVRRAEIRLAGNFIESIRWFVMADLAKNTSNAANGSTPPSGDYKILQDIGVGYTFVPGLELTVGQFKT